MDIVSKSASNKDASARKGDAVFLTPDMFMQQNDPYVRTNDFFERSIVKRVEEFGNLVEVGSTKESRAAKDEAQPSSRGVDSFQILRNCGRLKLSRFDLTPAGEIAKPDLSASARPV